MSHATVWRCRSCHAALGRIERRDLVTHDRAVELVTLLDQGGAILRCRACGFERYWRPRDFSYTVRNNRMIRPR